MQALQFCSADSICICNGDTFFAVDLRQMYHFHEVHCAQLTIATKILKNFDRYGTVQVSPEQRILGFEEKKLPLEG